MLCFSFLFILEDRDNEGTAVMCRAEVQQDDWGWGPDRDRLKPQEDWTLSHPALASVALGLL